MLLLSWGCLLRPSFVDFPFPNFIPSFPLLFFPYKLRLVVLRFYREKINFRSIDVLRFFLILSPVCLIPADFLYYVMLKQEENRH